MGRRRRQSRNRFGWAELPHEELLDVRFCDLGLALEGTWVEKCVERLYAEMRAAGLRLRPHVWLSEEWFSPDGIPGIAVPFYLMHPRLMRLERRMMLEVEGGTRRKCMMLLRHEAGHAVQHAYDLHRRRRWQQLFGLNSQPYPEYYRPRPGSRRYVQHLDGWYAQSHPAEDFAETFAVWLTPRSQWRERYSGWPALDKLEYVDELVGELRTTRATHRHRRRPDMLARLRTTLGEHYREKREHYAASFEGDYDDALCELFVGGTARPGSQTAATFLRRHRDDIGRTVCKWTGEHAFTVDQVMKEMILRCQERRLRTATPVQHLKLDVAVFLAVRTMQYRYRGSGWHAV